MKKLFIYTLFLACMATTSCLGLSNKPTDTATDSSVKVIQNKKSPIEYWINEYVESLPSYNRDYYYDSDAGYIKDINERYFRNLIERDMPTNVSIMDLFFEVEKHYNRELDIYEIPEDKIDELYNTYVMSFSIKYFPMLVHLNSDLDNIFSKDHNISKKDMVLKFHEFISYKYLQTMFKFMNACSEEIYEYSIYNSLPNGFSINDALMCYLNTPKFSVIKRDLDFIKVSFYPDNWELTEKQIKRINLNVELNGNR